MQRISNQGSGQSAGQGSRTGVQALAQVWSLNQRTATDLLVLTGESLRGWMELNQNYLRRVVRHPAPQRVLQLNAEYGRDLLGGVWNDARKRADVMLRASRELTALLGGTRPEPAASVAEAMDDDLQQIDGIGEAMARTLREAGIGTIAQLAALDVSLLEDENHPLHSVAGRIVADEWVEQARVLAGGSAG